MGSGTGGSNRGYSLTANVSWSTQEPTNNRTYVYTSIVLNCTNNYFQGWAGGGSFQVNGGVVQYYGGNYSMPSNNSSITIGSWEGWIGHDANGNGSITLWSDFDTASSPSYLPDYVAVSYNEGAPSNYDRSPNSPSINYTNRNAAGTTVNVYSNSTSAKNSGPGITDYNFQYSTDNANWSADQAMGTDLTGAFSGTSTQNYYVRSRAYNSDGWSAYGGSQLSYGFPTAPQSLGCTASGSVTGRINLSWTTPSSTNGGITGYKVYRKLSTDGSFPASPTATLNGTGTTYADDGLTRGLLYDYRITARNSVSDVAGGESAVSNTVTSVMAPGVPSAPTLSTVVASTDTFGKVTLTWTKPSNVNGGIVDYYLYADGVVKTSVTGENTLTGNITGLTPRQTYSFTVRARNQFAVDNGLTGDTSNAISRKSPGAPTAPLSLTSEAPFFPPGTVDLSWTAPTDVGTEGGTITGYTVYLAGSSTPLKTTTGTGTTTTVEDLIPATTYTFVIRARNEIADIVGTFSDQSNSTTATAQGEPNEPTNLVVVSDPLVAGRLILTWTPPVGYNTGFRVYTGAGALIANIATPRLEIDNLTPNTSYSYKVRARNPLTDLTGSEGGPFSATVAGTVGASSTQFVPSISATNNTNSTFVGPYTLVSTTSTTMSYSKVASTIAFASVPVSGGSTVNNTNTNLNGPYTVTVPNTTSVTFARAGADILANTSTPSGTMFNNTNVVFNGSYTVLGSPAPDPVTKTVSYTKVSADVSSRAASGVITNNSNAIFNGQHVITDVTENTIVYARDNSNIDIAESNAFGVVENKTNADIFNGVYTLSDTPDHKTVEYSTGDLTYGQNIITNPSMETVQSGSTTLRTNLCTNPGFETNVTGWTGTSASIARSSSYAHSGSYSGLVTPGSTSGSVAAASTTVSGQAYILSAWVYSEEATTLRLSVVSPVVTGATITIPADTWSRISVPFTANTTSTTYAVETVGSTQPFYLDNVLLEQTTELRPYFDGATTDALGWDYGWTGTANASTSTAKALTTTRTNLMANPSLEVSGAYGGNEITIVANSTEDFYVGTKSWKFTTTGGIASDFRTPVSSIAGSTTYTASIWIKATAGRVLKLKVQTWTSGYGRFDTQLSSDFTMTGAWQRLSYTWTTASDIVGAELGFAIDSSFASTVGYIDALMVEASSYAGTYFDGSTAGASWSGTANASTSILSGTQAIPVGLTGVSSSIVSTYARSHSGSVSALVSPVSSTGGASLTQTTTVSTVYTLSAWVYSDSAKNLKLSADSTVGSTVLVPAATWTRLSLSFTAEDSSTLLSVLGTDSTTAFYLDDVMLEASMTLQPYFDGDTDASATTWPVVYSWLGTPHASISTREVGETLPGAGAEILAPFGAASREQSEAQLQIRYRSGWLG